MDELDYIVCLMPMMFSDTVGSTGSSYDDSLSLKGACYMRFRTGWYTGQIHRQDEDWDLDSALEGHT